MSLKYQVLFRACDKVQSVHNTDRPFGLNKLQTIKVSFYSIYQGLKKSNCQFTIIGDELSENLLKFFNGFNDLVILNDRYGSAAKSLQKQIDLSLKIPGNEWVYFCEDDYLHTPNAFIYISDFIENSKRYIEISGKKKNFMNKIIGDLKEVPLVIHTPDYPDRYDPPWKRQSFIFLSKYCHWRQVSNTTHTFLLKSSTIKKFEKQIKASALGPSDSILSEKVYGRLFFKSKALCLSPIHGLSTHMTKGVMTPLVDWEKVCQQNIDMMKKEGIWE